MEDNETFELPDAEDFTDPSPNPANDLDLADVCDALKERGVTFVEIQYDGSGDSGSIEAVTYLPTKSSLPKEIEDKLQDVAEGYFPEGYENNEGGYGVLSVYPTAGLAMLEHSQRFEDAYEMDVSPEELPEALQARLARLGVTAVSGEFNGYADSGQVEQLSVDPTTTVLDPALAVEVEEFLLRQLSEGWENNDGAFGTFALDVATGDVDISGYWRTVDSSEHEICWNWRLQCPTPTIIL